MDERELPTAAGPTGVLDARLRLHRVGERFVYVRVFIGEGRGSCGTLTLRRDEWAALIDEWRLGAEVAVRIATVIV